MQTWWTAALAARHQPDDARHPRAPHGRTRRAEARVRGRPGALLGGAGGLLVGSPWRPGRPGSGPLATALAGAGIGAGVGALVAPSWAWASPRRRPSTLRPCRGGMVAVRRRTRRLSVVSIMERHSPIDIERRAAEWHGG